MRVLLLGGTGNLGLRCIPALLAYNHTLVLYVRNPEKLKSLVSREVIEKVEAVVVGDATDAGGIKRALVDHNVEGIIDVAGNQVLPWKEYVLPKIATAATEAAIEVGKQRGRPLRIWVTAGLHNLLIPGTKDYIESTLFTRSHQLTRMQLAYHSGLSIFTKQHQATAAIVSAISTTDLRWSLLCVAPMHPSNPDQGVFELLKSPEGHNLLLQGETAPNWQHSWLEMIPWIGVFLNAWAYQVWRYTTKYENVADVLAEDLKIGSDLWVGRRMGYIEKDKLKDL